MIGFEFIKRYENTKFVIPIDINSSICEGLNSKHTYEFMSFEDIAKLNTYGPLISYVTIPLDALVTRNGNKWTTNRIIVKKISSLADFDAPPEFKKKFNKYGILLIDQSTPDGYFRCLVVVQKNEFAIRHVLDHTSFNGKLLCIEAVKKNPWVLPYIRDLSFSDNMDILDIAVSHNGYAIAYVENPSEQLQIRATEQCGDAIRYIKNPCYAAKLAAVRQNGLVIEFIEDPTDEIYEAAIEQNKHARQFINL